MLLFYSACLVGWLVVFGWLVGFFALLLLVVVVEVVVVFCWLAGFFVGGCLVDWALCFVGSVGSGVGGVWLVACLGSLFCCCWWWWWSLVGCLGSLFCW